MTEKEEAELRSKLRWSGWGVALWSFAALLGVVNTYLEREQRIESEERSRALSDARREADFSHEADVALLQALLDACVAQIEGTGI